MNARTLSARVAALVATALTLVAVSASPAFAEPALDRTLPNAGDKLFVMPCYGQTHDLLEIDVATGVTTPVGTERDVDVCWSQGFYNPADGLIYGVNWDYSDPDGNYVLQVIDPATGVVTDVGSITEAGSGDYLDQHATALSPDGAAYMVDGSSLYTLDLNTGTASLVGDLELDGIPKGSFFSLAFNPVDGLLYGTDWDSGHNWYSISTTDASLTVVNDTWNTNTGNSNAGLAFDSNGVAWHQLDNLRSIASGVLPELDATTANFNEVTLSGENFYFESVIYVPAAVVEPTPTPEAVAETAAPALAATGVDAAALTTGAGATALLLLAGVALVLTRRRQNA
jgi:LPXTG-motif cell wall-anchored protein